MDRRSELDSLARSLARCLAGLEAWAARGGDLRAAAAVSRQRRLLRALLRAGGRRGGRPWGQAGPLSLADLIADEWRLVRAASAALPHWPAGTPEAVLLAALRDDCEQVALALRIAAQTDQGTAPGGKA
ncbi:MAG TPA: hypothetical protein PKC84_10580 [Paracoccaceae bacterium]|nr:hypothetical protein [Paracoccaceae bacterium]